jgi:hypothetical protein
MCVEAPLLCNNMLSPYHRKEEDQSGKEQRTITNACHHDNSAAQSGAWQDARQ